MIAAESGETEPAAGRAREGTVRVTVDVPGSRLPADSSADHPAAGAGDATLDLVVIGLGYVGLPLAQEAVRSGLRVAGLDRDEHVVRSLAAGESHVDDVPAEAVAAMLAGGFVPTTDAAVIARARNVVICVPTPLSPDGAPDLAAVRGATGAVAGHVRPGTLVVLESTTYPGTTEEVLKPSLEAGGLLVGQDLFLAFSPERIDPGNPDYGFRNTPKVVGGVTPACTARAAAFYDRIVDTVVTARGTREAEMTKLLENTYRHVNIALVNEMARFCHELGIELWDVIRCASTKPFGFQPFYPGPGVGGHCIPIDPNYLSHEVRARLGYPFRFVELAQEVNAGMPAYVAHRIQDALNDQGKAVRGSSVLLLGITYKADISDQRESPARPLAKRLRQLGATVTFHDPHVARWRVDAEDDPDDELTCVPDLTDAAAKADIVVLLQRHTAYDLDAVSRAAHLVLDTRGAMPDAPTVEHL
jgi:UDP-N-acetyl-D-glucosamine dehydrogenase